MHFLLACDFIKSNKHEWNIANNFKNATYINLILTKFINRPSGEEFRFYTWWYKKFREIADFLRNFRPPGEEFYSKNHSSPGGISNNSIPPGEE